MSPSFALYVFFGTPTFGNIFLHIAPIKYGIYTEINLRGKKVIYSYLEDNKTTLHAFICYTFVSNVRRRSDSK